MKKLIILLVLCLSCATTPKTFKSTVTIENDTFKKVTIFSGIEHKLYEGSGSRYFLRSFYNQRTKALTHQIYVVAYYGYSWRFYYSAIDITGKEYGFLPIDSYVSCHHGCLYTEHFGINITTKDMLNNPHGITFKIYSKSGEPVIFELTNQQINAQLSAIKSNI